MWISLWISRAISARPSLGAAGDFGAAVDFAAVDFAVVDFSAAFGFADDATAFAATGFGAAGASDDAGGAAACGAAGGVAIFGAAGRVEARPSFGAFRLFDGAPMFASTSGATGDCGSSSGGAGTAFDADDTRRRARGFLSAQHGLRAGQRRHIAFDRRALA